MEIIGRKLELEELKIVSQSDCPEFVVVYGRRRVGKTYLINQFFNNEFSFKVTGIATKKSRQIQLANFGESLRKYGSPLCPDPKNWTEAFRSLKILLENVSHRGKLVVFFDELPYMNTKRSDFMLAFEHFWNDWGSTQKSLLLIVCGSATSWIVKNIVKNKGGLHNRLTRKIYLKPFNLRETKEYLASRGLKFSDRDIVETYMIMGGIPYYLSLLEKGKSLAQNIDELFFVRKGRLDGEFDNLYAALFEESENYIKVVQAISRKNRGLSRQEIIDATGLTNGGGLTRILEDLDQCDMIRKYNSYGKKQNNALYQLTDFYTLFYYKFIQKHSPSEKGYWAFQLNTPSVNAWKGYAFEQLCMYHYGQIEKALGISGILTEVSSWQSSDAQIDLIIERADRIVNVCEIKYWAGPFAITKKYNLELENKIQSFIRHTRTTKGVHLVFISTCGVVQNEYSGIVQREVTVEDLFT